MLCQKTLANITVLLLFFPLLQQISFFVYLFLFLIYFLFHVPLYMSLLTFTSSMHLHYQALWLNEKIFHLLKFLHLKMYSN